MSSTRATLSIFVAGLLGTTVLGQVESAGDRFAEPFPIMVDGGVLEFTERGVFPALGDFDGDSRRDLLVGHNSGRLRVLLNVGTDDRPRFSEPIWFDEILPDGRIPTG